MSDSPLLRVDHFDANMTGPHPGNGLEIPSRRVRLARGSNSGRGFTDEMSSLLRTRLRLAILIILAVFAVSFLRSVLLQGLTFVQRRPWRVITGSEIALLVIISGVLWSRRPLSARTLRILELTIFATVAASLAWVQIDYYHDGVLLRSVVTGREGSVYRLAGLAAALRWFLVIVL